MNGSGSQSGSAVSGSVNNLSRKRGAFTEPPVFKLFAEFFLKQLRADPSGQVDWMIVEVTWSYQLTKFSFRKVGS